MDYQTVREASEKICAGLKIEDYVVQPHEFVSPPKWHLGHTTWLFETFCLKKFFNIEPYHSKFHFIFNSYYESQGEHLPQSRRGTLSRPTVDEVLAYRRHVDGRMREAADMIRKRGVDTIAQWDETLELGLHHEQQHQELLLMDIKNIFSYQPELPALGDAPLEQVDTQPANCEWLEMHAGLYGVGSEGKGFAYDNEKPRHSVYLRAFKIRSSLVTNQEYCEFIADGGYSRPELWLADGWNWVQTSNIQAPLYWNSPDSLFTLQGECARNPRAPVSHVSYFEADAFARWKKCRLPTEAEWEITFSTLPKSPLWQWTQSAYLPYPGYEPYPGALMEYNGKFMSGQMVLRGGSLATPDSHYRHSYRNFFYPQMRWMFSGIRLCAH